MCVSAAPLPRTVATALATIARRAGVWQTDYLQLEHAHMNGPSTSQIIEILAGESPEFHRGRDGSARSFVASKAILEFINAHVRKGSTSVETGAGASTVVFAAAGAHHTTIAPYPEEFERVKAFCEAHAITTADIRFVPESSESALPKLDIDNLDFVFIDGSHSFPSPFIDWYYTAFKLKVGGIVVVDDLQLWTGTVLKQFLDAEPEWELIEVFAGRSAAFVKRQPVTELKNWMDQPFVARKSRAGRYLLMSRQATELIRQGDARTLARKVAKKARTV